MDTKKTWSENRRNSVETKTPAQAFVDVLKEDSARIGEKYAQILREKGARVPECILIK